MLHRLVVFAPRLRHCAGRARVYLMSMMARAATICHGPAPTSMGSWAYLATVLRDAERGTGEEHGGRDAPAMSAIGAAVPLSYWGGMGLLASKSRAGAG